MKLTAKKSLAALLALIMLMSCIGLGASATDRGEFSVIRQNCTMYGDTQTQRGFSWYTEKDCDTALQLVKAEDFDGTFDDALVFEGESKLFQENYNHKVVVTGLEPGTEYVYRVGSIDENVWGNISRFVTDDGDGSFSFLAIADVQASSVQNFYKASLVLDKGVEFNPDAEFIINLGDFVNDCTNEEWTWWGDAFEDFNTNYTLVPAAGNHEGNITNKLNIGWFENMFNLKPAEGSLTVNGVYYSYDYGNAHFCVINSNDMYPMIEAQRNWIVNDLNSSDATWKIVLMHRSAYSAGKNINKPDTIAMRETIIELMDETGADLVLSGHDHMYMRTAPVKGDAVCEDTEYVTEVVNGKEVTYALNPEGTVYALPGTAGTKRYEINENAIDPINDCAEVSKSLKNLGGSFANIVIDDDMLTYEAYAVKDGTLELEKLDEFAIKKTEAKETEGGTKNPTDFIGTIDATVWNFVSEIFGMLLTYLTKLLPQVIKGLF